MADVMRWAVTFAFNLTSEEIDTLTPIVEAQDLGLLQAAVERICGEHGFGPEGGAIIDMWRDGDEPEMEMI